MSGAACLGAGAAMPPARAPSLSPRSVAAAVAGLAALVAFAARAQDFQGPAPGGPADSPLALIEAGLPSAVGATRVAGATTAWFGLGSLTTRAFALGGGWRGGRGAVGISQTGDPDLGWSALGMALGGAGPACGASVRAVARRDRAPGTPAGPLGAGVGLEAGAGAWAAAGAGLVLWTVAPQLWLAGESPPLVRSLEIGGRLRLRGGSVWIARRAGPRDLDAPAEHEAGIVLETGSCSAWARARDGPLRAGVGLSARARLAGVCAEVSSHPVLGETVSLEVALPGRALRPRGSRPERAP